MRRNYNFVDQTLVQINEVLNTLFTSNESQRKNPAFGVEEPSLNEEEKRKSAALMRVNHSGEICAQALYMGQLLVAKNQATKNFLQQSSQEEKDHLKWTAKRIQELHGHTSYLNTFWFCGSYFLGFIASCMGDRNNLGFVEETERQVSEHLQKHLNYLPLADSKSRKIIEQMREDEILHGKKATEKGAKKLPSVIKFLMKAHAKIMTTLSYWI